MRVEQLMRRDMHTCRLSEPLHVPVKIMWEHDCGRVAVLRDGAGGHQVVGMITDRDICLGPYTKGLPLAAMRTGDLVSNDVASCRPTDAINVALKIMETKQLHRLPVIDKHDQLVGVISLSDLACEANRERGLRTKSVTAADIGIAVGAISAPRGASREVLSAA